MEGEGRNRLEQAERHGEEEREGEAGRKAEGGRGHIFEREAWREHLERGRAGGMLQ